jgi:hypothetical protein
MQAVPGIAVTPAHACKVGARTPRTELERTVVHGFTRRGIRPVTFCFAAERPHHLRVAAVAALSNKDVAPGEPQWRIGFDILCGLRRLARDHEREQFDETTDTHREHDKHHHQIYAFLNYLMTHEWSLLYAGSRTATGTGFCSVTVLKTLKAMMSMPVKNTRPPSSLNTR